MSHRVATVLCLLTCLLLLPSCLETEERLVEPGGVCKVVRTGDLNGDGVDELVLVVHPAATAADVDPSPSIWVKHDRATPRPRQA